jgi:hypothetical protein
MTDQPDRPRLPPSREMLRAVGQTPMPVDMWTSAEDVERRSRSIRDGDGDPYRVARTELTEACHVRRCSWGLIINGATATRCCSRP